IAQRSLPTRRSSDLRSGVGKLAVRSACDRLLGDRQIRQGQCDADAEKNTACKRGHLVSPFPAVTSWLRERPQAHPCAATSASPPPHFPWSPTARGQR